ncbi:hypothetical protein HZR84_03985 [Hyphobacterium sp. CCMP332]|nr:hypothetical protein HZR84_03985 [Hyphobacterium sp. CCMP332]
MRKYYFLIVLALIVANTNAQVTISNGANIFLSTGSIFSTDMDVTLSGNAVITNNGDFDAGSMILNNTGIFNNNNGASFDLLSNIRLNNTSQFINNTGATALITDTTFVSSTLANTGDFGSRYYDILSGGTAQNGGVFQIQNSFIAAGGATVVTNTGELAFVGNDDNKRINTDAIGANLDVGNVTFNASNPARNIILESVLRINNTADFNSGLVSYQDPTQDSLVVLSGGLVTMDSATGNGIMTDALYRYPGSVGEFMRFPVGDASPKFRPFWVMSAQYGGAPPKIAVEYLGNKTIADTNAIGYNTTYNTNSWGFYEIEGNFDSSRVQVQYGSGDGVDTVESIIAQGYSIAAGDTIFFNLGQGNSSTNGIGGIVQSKIPANGDNSVIMIGQSTELRVRVLAYLEGAQNSGGGAVFDTAIYGTGQLTNRFVYPGTTSQPMFPGKVIPNAPLGAIDSIRLILRDVGNNDIDTASAWLMSDGSIRDYLTGELNYAVFNSAPNGPSYYVVLDHRNHLKVRSSSTVTPLNTGPGVLVDFTDPTEIFGGGGIKLISPVTAMIAGGNSNGDFAVNAIDYYQVAISNNLSETGYRNTNVTFNSLNAGNVDAADLSKVQANSQVIYFSTAQ